MLYHKQEFLSSDFPGKGSCYPTVIACLLGLPLNQVPCFNLFYYSAEEKVNLIKVFTHQYLDGKDIKDADENSQMNFNHNVSLALNHWWNTLLFFLAAKGLRIQNIATKDIDLWLSQNVNVPYMVTGISSRGVNHIVIYVNGKLHHDPHPSDEGIVELIENPYEILVAV